MLFACPLNYVKHRNLSILIPPRFNVLFEVKKRGKKSIFHLIDEGIASQLYTLVNEKPPVRKTPTIRSILAYLLTQLHEGLLLVFKNT